MKPMPRVVPLTLLSAAFIAVTGTASAAEVQPEKAAAPGAVTPPISLRFATEKVEETPDFRQHMAPLLGKLGCNSRACHGSFQGQGDFRLSLFGYDFQMDHEGLTQGDEPRVDVEYPEESLALEKPTLTIPHRGGKRLEVGSWEYRVFLNWIKGGAKGAVEDQPDFVRMEITPSEIQFNRKGQEQQLEVVAVWADGSREDVTPLCRFESNSTQQAEVSADGLVTAVEPGDTHIIVSYDRGVVPVPILQPVTELAGANYPDVPAPTAIDRHVVNKLRKLGIVQSETCSDADFLRRVRLDMTGTLPSAKEVEAFLADGSPDKRSRKIDELLETPAYAAWWTTRLCDFTGNNEGQLNNVNPIRGRTSRDWYDWIYKRVSENTSYADLIAGIVVGNSRNKGESYLEYCTNMSAIYGDKEGAEFADRESMPYFWARRNLRLPEERAIGFAYTFLGIRIQCAQCHKHPFDQWTQDDFRQFGNFFTTINNNRGRPAGEDRKVYEKLLADLNLKDLRGNDLRRKLPDLLREGKVVPFVEISAAPPGTRGGRGSRSEYVPGGTTAKLLGGDVVDLTEYDDPREPLMEWLRSSDNDYFARAFVNRVWAAYFNRGIVEPPDNLALANPPCNKELLDYLSRGFIDSNFDMKWLHREITNSRTYQLSWQPNDTNRLDEVNFSRAVPRRLPAEVTYDALVMATGSDSKVEEMHGSTEGRAIAMASAGYRNNRNGANYALTIFGRSSRENNCDCDRSSDPSLLQTVFLQNDNEVMQMISENRNSWLGQLAAERDPRRGRQAAAGGNGNELRRRLFQRLQKAKKDGNRKQVIAIQQQLQRLRQRAVPQRAEPVAISEGDTESLIRQAYLRSLSRYPDDQELARAQEFVQQKDDALEGLRDLLWALINTKEFIVNH